MSFNLFYELELLVGSNRMTELSEHYLWNIRSHTKNFDMDLVLPTTPERSTKEMLCPGAPGRCSRYSLNPEDDIFPEQKDVIPPFELDSQEAPQKEAPQKEAPQKEAPQKEAPQKEAPQVPQEAPQEDKETPPHFSTHLIPFTLIFAGASTAILILALITS